MARDPDVAHVYAESLLKAARRAGKVDQVFEDADALHRCFPRDTQLKRFLESPRIRKDVKHDAINRILRGRADELIINLVHVMLRNNRIENLDDTLALVYELVEEQRGIIPSSVTTAIELTPEQKHEMKRCLEQRLGLRFNIRFRVDPKILGGVVFKYRDRQIDGSLLFDLQKIRERLMALSID